MAGLGAPFSPLSPYDVTDFKGAVTAGRRMEAKVALGSCMESSGFLSIHTDRLITGLGWLVFCMVYWFFGWFFPPEPH